MTVAVKRRQRRILLAVIGLAVIVGGVGLYTARRIARNREFAEMRDQGMEAAARLIAELEPRIEREWQLMARGTRQPAIVSLRRERVPDELVGRFDQTTAKLAMYLHRYRESDRENEQVLSQFARLRPMIAGPVDQSPAHIIDTMNALRRLLAADPGRTEERRMLLRVFALLRWRAETLDTAERLLTDDPEDVEALRARAQALADLQRTGEALRANEQWLKQAPRDLDAHLQRLRILGRMHRGGDDLQAAARAYPADHPRASDAGHHLLVAFAAAVSRDVDGARAHLARMLDVLALDRAMRSVPWLRHAASQTPLDDVFIPSAARQLDFSEMFPQALQVLRLGEGLGSRRLLLARLWETDRQDEFLAMLGRFDPARPLGYDTELLGMWAVSLGGAKRGAEAGPILEALEARKNDPRAAVWLAVARSALGEAVEPRQIIALCRAATPAALPRQTPTRGPAGYLSLYMGDAFAQLGEASQAVACWAYAIEQQYAWPTPYLRLTQAILWANPREAVAGADGALRRAPSLRAARVLGAAARGVAALRLQPPDEVAMRVALDDADKLARDFADDTQLLEVRVRLQAAVKQTQAARSSIQRFLDAANKPAETDLLRLAEISRELKLGLEEACLSQAQSLYGVTAQSTLVRAAALMSEKKFDAALGLIDRNAASGKGEPRLWKLARARALDMAGEPRRAEAREAWMALAAAHASELQIQQFALHSPAVKGEREFLEQTIARMRAITGEEAVSWRLDRARWLLDASTSEPGLAEAETLLSDVLKKSPDATDGQVLLAECRLRRNNSAGAIEQMAITSSRNPNSASLALDYARLLLRDRQSDRALAEVRRVRSLSLSTEHRRIAAELLFQLNQTDEALAMIQPVIATTTRPVIDLLQARLYRRSRQYDKVLPILEKLLKQAAPDYATITFAADFYASIGRRGDAEHVLWLLDNLQLAEGVKEMALADYAMRYSDPKEALGRLRAATRAAPQNAIAWQKLVLWHISRGEGDDAAAAARAAAKALPVHPVFAAVVQHSEIIRAAAATPEFRPLAVTILDDANYREAAVEILQVLVEAAKNRTPMQKVIPRLRKFAESYPHLAPLQFYVAGAFLALREYDEALAFAGRAGQRFPASGEPPRIVASALAGAGRWSQVPAAVQRWRARAGENTLLPDLLEAQACLRLGRPADALPLLEPHLPAVYASPQAYLPLVSLYATVLVAGERLDRAPTALALIKQYSPIYATAVIPPVRNAARLATAEAWLKQAAATLGTSDEAQIAMAEAYAITGVRFRVPQYTDKARELLADLKGRFGLAMGTRLRMAQLHEQIGDSAAAESLYRYHLALRAETPELKDLRAAVANNLVMLLAGPRRGTPGDLNEALKLADEVVQNMPDVAVFWDTHAYVRQRRGDYKQAADDAEKSIALSPNDPDGYVRLAEIQLDAGQRDLARKALKSAVDRMNDEVLNSPAFTGRVADLKARLGEPTSRPDNVQAQAP